MLFEPAALCACRWGFAVGRKRLHVETVAAFDQNVSGDRNPIQRPSIRKRRSVRVARLITCRRPSITATASPCSTTAPFGSTSAAERASSAAIRARQILRPPNRRWAWKSPQETLTMPKRLQWRLTSCARFSRGRFAHRENTARSLRERLACRESTQARSTPRCVSAKPCRRLRLRRCARVDRRNPTHRI